MIFMAVPITGLYFLACFMSIQHDKRVARRRAREEAELDAALAGQPVADSASLSAPASSRELPAAGDEA